MFKPVKFAFAASVLFTAVLLLPSSAQASPTCTTKPKSEWLSEDAMKEKVAQLGYRDIRVFKTTKSGCYEIYGLNAEGKKAEVYFNPVDGSVVQANVD
jgi:hypothetical protein